MAPPNRRDPKRWATTPDSVVAWSWYVDGVRQDCADLQNAIEAARGGEGFVWLGLKDPTDDDMAAFARQFDLHTLAIEDAVEGHTRSKLEVFGSTLFTVISTVSYVPHETLTATSEVVSTGQIMVFTGDNYVLTVRRGEHTPLKSLRATLESDERQLARGPYYVLYRILDTVVDDYVQVVTDIEEDVDELEESVFSTNSPSPDVDRIYQLKRELIEFRRCVTPLGLPLQALATRELPVVPEGARAYFREVADHHTEARESIASFDDVLTTLLQAALARASVADNQDMRKISAAVALFAIPTTIGAIYGMNFDNMPELHTQYGYFVVLAVMVASMVAAYAFFRHNRWL
ncbi:magnesium/cobalt transporter CorA [Aestuariimicrobium soli]|uniref:magnesium/cobalt transporter CorA n=1 Tax=Aestuariimicrobium soli TaxID=2035834 RepID=UPI003EB78DD2